MNSVFKLAHNFLSLFGILLLTACNNPNNTGNNATNNPQPNAQPNTATNAANFSAAKGCKNVGILLPESDSSARYEAYDRPLLEKEIKQAIPDATIQYANANNNADTQQNQAEAALTKGACILVVDPNDSDKASVIVQRAKANQVPVIPYDRLIQDPDTAYYVYQDLALCDNLDVVANLWLGRETYRWLIPGMLKVLDETEMERQTLDVLRTLDVKIPSVRRPVAALSGGQRQCIAVAKTILRQPKVVLLDEPTAALGVAQTRQVLNLIMRLKQQGLAVVVISHNLHDVFEVADRAIVMRLGQRAATFEIKQSTSEQIVAAITGAEYRDPKPTETL
jgi:D-xylose transport system ATP-binding protein